MQVTLYHDYNLKIQYTHTKISKAQHKIRQIILKNPNYS